MHINVERVFSTVSRNLGLKDYSRYIDNWVEWSYEAEKLIGSRDTFVQKEATYDASGAKATGTITFSANPTTGDSITLNGVKLYFRTASDLGEAKSPNEIKISKTLIETMNSAIAQYGLIQSLTGLINITPQTNFSTGNAEYANNNQQEAPLQDINTGSGTYTNSAIYNYPEALNVADYTVTENTGDDLVTNGSFTGGSTGWTLGSGYSYGTNNITSNAVQFSHLRQDLTTIEANKTYRVTFTISNYTAGEIYVFLISEDTPEHKGQNRRYKGSATTGTMGNGTYSLVVDVDTAELDGGVSWWSSHTTGSIRLSNQLSANADFTIDDVSVVEITSTQLNITSKEIGPKGNEYTISSDNANAQVSGATLTGGKGMYRNQQITLPEDNIKVLGVRVGTNDSTYEHASIKKTSAVHRGRVGKTTDDSEQKAFRYYIEGNRLNVQHDSLDEITIVYLKYPTDIRGWPMIKEGHETAVAQYIMWQMKLIEFYNGKLPQYITKELEKRWYFLCGKARGDDSMPTSEELKQIGSMWNTLVPITNRRSSLIDF